MQTSPSNFIATCVGLLIVMASAGSATSQTVGDRRRRDEQQTRLAAIRAVECIASAKSYKLPDTKLTADRDLVISLAYIDEVKRHFRNSDPGDLIEARRIQIDKSKSVQAIQATIVQCLADKGTAPE